MAARTKNTTKAEAEVTETPAEGNITVKQLCEELDAEPKAFRRWLRTQTTERAGRGGRWTFSPETAEQVKAAYKARSTAKATEPVINADDN